MNGYWRLCPLWQKKLARVSGLLASVAALVLAVFIPVYPALAREGTEWVTAYWFNANDTKLPRVLFIGDSIVKGYAPIVRDELAGEAYVAYYATSKGVDDPAYLQELGLMFGQYEYKAIVFNNGLHSLYTDREKWKAGLTAALKMIQEKGKGAKIVWVSSTPLKDSALTAKAVELNAIADQVMKPAGIPTVDLFALMNPLDRSRYWVDTYHFTPEGIKMEAGKLSETIRSLLSLKKVSSAEADAALAGAASDTGPDGKIVTQVLRNGDFETAEGWMTYPPDGSKGMLEIQDTGAHSGHACAKITATSKGLQLYQQSPAFDGGKTYAVSFWAKADEEGMKILPYVRTVKPPYQFYGKHDPILLTMQWSEYRVTVSTPADYAPPQCRFFFDFLKEGGCQIDGIGIREISTP